jgi:ribosomal protein S18 acetylase RimI-like enzyme
MRIREARVEDVPALMRLWAEFVAHEEAFDPAEFDVRRKQRKRYRDLFIEKLSDPEAAVFVAEDGELVGYAMGWLRHRFLGKGQTGYVNDVFVTEKARRKGIGGALMKTLVAWFKSRGADKVDLYVYAANEKAMGLYDSLGFRIIAHRLTKELK